MDSTSSGPRRTKPQPHGLLRTIASLTPCSPNDVPGALGAVLLQESGLGIDRRLVGQLDPEAAPDAPQDPGWDADVNILVRGPVCGGRGLEAPQR